MMKRFGLFILLMAAMLDLCAKNPKSDALVALLKKCLAVEEVRPDSLYGNLRMLEARKAMCSDATERAVLSTVLGRLYADRAWRASAYRFATPANPDSLQEWAQMDWYRASARNFNEAFDAADVLMTVPASAWTPLTVDARNPHRQDMLSVAWSTMSERLERDIREEFSVPTYSWIVNLYETKGKRDVALLLTLDSLNHSDFPMDYRYDGGPRDTTRQRILEDLCQRYAEEDVCAEVYLALSQLNGLTPQQRRQHLQDGLARYPRYERKMALSNALTELSAPRLEWHGWGTAYPERRYDWTFSVRNTVQTKWEVYRLPHASSLVEKNLQEGWSAARVRKEGKLTQSGTRTFAKHDEIETFDDTLNWTAPKESGRYALVLTPTVKAKTKNAPKPLVTTFTVTKKKTLLIDLPDGSVRCEAVDAVSGAPLDCDCEPDDLPKGRRSVRSFRDTTTHEEVRLFTDRSIYRPGQQAHVSGLVYSQKEWGSKATEGRTLTLKFFDTNRKVLQTLEVTTDAYGAFGVDLQLPADECGYFQVSCGSARCGVRVEEYKRPTFEVTFDPAPEVHFPVDSVTLSGRALRYNGTPLRNARVTGTYHWRASRWCFTPFTSRYQPLDTLQTDAEGRFTLRIPVEGKPEQHRFGVWAHVNVSVTSPDGETHEGQTSLTLCSQAVRLTVSCPTLLNRHKPESLMLVAYSSSEKEMETPVTLHLFRLSPTPSADEADKAMGETLVHDTLIKSGQHVDLSILTRCPAGRYEWRATAIHEGDTARWRQQFLLCDERGTTLPVDTALWCYSPDLTFAPGEPARLQIGSSLPEAYLYLTAMANDHVVKDTTICLKGVQNIDVPFRESYGNALTISMVLVRDERVYTDVKTFKLKQPDTQLQYKWHTFRNLLRPGQEEEWTLTLTRPDGTPADASLMATMYDASLDAFVPHHLSLSIHRPYHILWNSWTSPYARPANLFMSLAMRLQKELELDCSRLNDSYFHIAMKEYGGWRMRGVSGSKAMPMMMKVESLAAGNISSMSDEAAVYATAAAPVNGATGTVTEDAESEDDAMEETGDIVHMPMRENFNETAFFFPSLVTNEQGQVALRFTLPESLTQWHLLGLAHTRDMLTAHIDETVTARKELMGELRLPRFLRQGDNATLTATINNVSDKTQAGHALLTVLDDATEKVLMRKSVPFSLAANADTVCTFAYTPRKDASSLIVRWQVQGTNCTDGEQRLLPILSDREWVTDTHVLWLDKPGKQDINLKELSKINGDSMRVTVEYTTRPIWLALEALPTMAQPCRRDALSLATAYYAVGMATFIKERVPAWSEDSVLAAKPLQKDEMERWLNKLCTLQNPDGSFSWYPGMPASTYITTEVAFFLARLQAQTGKEDKANVLAGCMKYLTAHTDTMLSVQALRQLYIQGLIGTKLNKIQRRLVDELPDEAKQWSREQQALAAIVLKQQGHDRKARRQMEQLNRFLVTSPDRGTYIDYPEGALSSIDTKLRVHTLLMEALQTVTPNDAERLSGMRRWLLQQKRVQGWDTPTQCVDAVHALVGAYNFDADFDTEADQLTLRAGKRMMRLAPTDRQKGYVRQTFDVAKAPSSLQINKLSESESWGAVFVESLQQVDSILSASSGLRVRREWNTEGGVPNSALKKGDRIVLRYVITAERDYEFISMEAERPACTEPVEQLSQCCWQDGLCLYRSVRDSRTEYFFHRMPRGTYVIEEDVYVERPGTYATGLTTIRCEYAKEFQGRTGSARMLVQ